jgi:hypothetical protein
MTTEEKLPFEKLALEDKLRESKQRLDLKTKGYFVLEDGSKSTDAANQKQKRAAKSKQRVVQEETATKR